MIRFVINVFENCFLVQELYFNTVSGTYGFTNIFSNDFFDFSFGSNVFWFVLV